MDKYEWIFYHAKSERFMNNFIDLLHYASIGLKQGHYATYSTTIMAPCPTTSFNLSNIIVNPLISNAPGPTYYC